MKHKFIIILLAVVISGETCLAQIDQSAVVEDFQPASSNQPGRQYPQVDSEGRVRARVVAPQAKSVLLDIGGVRYPLKKGEDGAWIGDSAPQDEGFHYYQLNIDGAKVQDPGSMIFYGAGRWGSGVKVPAKDQDFYALKTYTTVGYARIYIFPRAPAVCAAVLFTRRLIMIRTQPNAIPCFTCNMAAAKTRLAGPIRARPI